MTTSDYFKWPQVPEISHFSPCGVKESCQVQPFDHKDPASTEPSLRHVELTLEGSTGASQEKCFTDHWKNWKKEVLLAKYNRIAYSVSHYQDDDGWCHIACIFGGRDLAAFCSNIRPCETCYPLERSTWLMCSRLGHPTEFGVALKGEALLDQCSLNCHVFASPNLFATLEPISMYMILIIDIMCCFLARHRDSRVLGRKTRVNREGQGVSFTKDELIDNLWPSDMPSSDQCHQLSLFLTLHKAK